MYSHRRILSTALNDTGGIPSVTTIEDDAVLATRGTCCPNGSGSDSEDDEPSSGSTDSLRFAYPVEPPA